MTSLIRPLLALADGLAWTCALALALWLRLEFVDTFVDFAGLAWMTALAVALQWAIGGCAQTYRGRYCIGSVDEVVNLTTVVGATGAILFVVDVLVTPQPVPRSVPISAALIVMLASTGLRLALRRLHERSRRPRAVSAQRAIVLGAGGAGQQLVRSMLSDQSGGYLPVAMLDDDPKKRPLRVCGVPVRGTRADLAAVADETGADLLVIAIRSADATVIRDVSRVATSARLAVKVLPPMSEMFRSCVRLNDLRDLDIADLLGRRQVDTDVRAIAGYLANRRVLVTGAGGSIGSELCRQIRQYAPAELMMLDRDESALHAVQLSIEGRALLDSSDVILADIRDRETLTEIFAARRPEVVFHAAALKHLPMLEQYPVEAWKTNVLGTMNVLDAARDTGVSTLINISTDKAANPVSMLGRSKRIGERLVAGAAGTGEHNFLSVRFGNVLGSRGSVLTTFAEQLSVGGPVTVTDPDVTRYFMTTAEAVQLVIQAAAIGRPGEALVLDMGTPVRIANVARQLMEISGTSAQIVYTGLREGEKLHEEMFGPGERDDRPFHPAISHVDVPPLDVQQVTATSPIGRAAALVELAGHRRSDADEPASARTVQMSTVATEALIAVRQTVGHAPAASCEGTSL